MNSVLKAIEENQKEIDKVREIVCHGPWNNEPDRVEFVHAGFNCLLQRVPLLTWCGYVGLPEDHPLYGETPPDLYVHGGITYAEYSHGKVCHLSDQDTKPLQAYHIRTRSINVHGGITYAEYGHGKVCHLSDQDTKPLFWLGFDCAHFGDFIPEFNDKNRFEFATYKDLEFVKAETKRLAERLLKLKLISSDRQQADF